MTKNALLRLCMFIAGSATIALIMMEARPLSELALTPTYDLRYITMTPAPPLVAEAASLPDTATPVPLTALPAAPAAPTIDPASLSQNTIAHTIQTGDNLYRIAQAYEVSLEALIAINNLPDPSRVQVGQVIYVPGEGVPLAAIPTVQPSATTIPSPSPSPAVISMVAEAPPAAPVGAPPLVALNNVTLEQIVVMPPETEQHVREIWARGQELGNNPRAFSKLGDSIIENPYFLARFDDGPYNLGQYAYLQPVIDYFAGSFGRSSVAVRRGLHSWSVFNPTWADKRFCQPNETVIACEFRLHRPSLVFVRLGSNDVGVPQSFERNMRQIVTFSIENGVIPVLGTKADRHEGPGDINNTIIRQITAEYHVPLWDFDRVASTVPGKGLEVDGVHLTAFYAHDYTQPVALTRGHGLHNLTALMALDRIWRVVSAG
jgi:LysM repeat protein